MQTDLTPKIRAAPRDAKAAPAVGDAVSCEVTDVAPLYLDVKLAQGELKPLLTMRHCLTSGSFEGCGTLTSSVCLLSAGKKAKHMRCRVSARPEPAPASVSGQLQRMPAISGQSPL